MALTPMMTQYLATKEKHKDAILFYRLGDFYELFFEDAIKCSKLLDITLTGKDCGLETRAPMCGVPYHAVESYVGKLIENGEKVAICEQLTVPEKGKIVERDVVRIITPGTVFEDSMLDEGKNNYICSIFKKDFNIGVSYADITTGDFYTFEFIEETSLRDLNDFLVRINPAEIICNKEAKESYIELSAYKMDALPKPFEYYDWAFENQKATANIKRQFGNSAILIYELSNNLFSIASSGALLEYLIETQKRGLSHISKIKKIINNDFMILDLNTRRNLEITETIRDRKKKGSLLWLLDQTKTSMGARLFKNWLDEPLKNAEKINLRLDAVEEIVNSYELKENLTKILANINDIERLCGKIAFGSINPKECRALCSSLEQIPDLKDALKFATSSKLHSFYDNIADFSAVQKELDNAIIIDPPFLLKDGGYINENYNSLLKDYRHAGTEGKKWLAEIEAREKEKTGIKNLKIGFNKVFGYYAEINKSQIENVPLNYQRKQTVANNERYIFEDLKIVEEKILGAEDNAIKLEQEIFSNLREGLLKIIPSLQTLSKIISEIDCLFSLAVCALKNNYVKPKVSSKISHIKIEDGRHPVVEAIMKDNSFIPNDTYLNTTSDKIMVITGPNMAGKSTFMRQVAVLTFMAHIGSFVPAKSAEFSVTDRIFTRVGASDDLAFGQSTFMVEMTEVALILANATKDSLIILDEIGRGTSTFDGLSIAWAVIEYISNHFEAKTLFATHYHELTELEGLLNGVKNYRISIKEFNNSIIFLRKIVRGGANRSFGIEVASLAGLPKCVIDRAKEINYNLEERDLNKNLSIANLKTSVQHSQIEAETKLKKISQILDELNIEKISPIDAFETLHNLIKIKKEK